MKPGDVVWIPLYVAGVRHGVEVVMAANPGAAKAGRGSVSALDTEVLPCSPALPALARWLAVPGNVEAAIALLEGVDWHYETVDVERAGKALHAALAGEPVAQEADGRG